MKSAQAVEETEHSNAKSVIHSANRIALSSVLASGFGNFISLSAAHPLDTLKIRLQMDTRAIGIRQLTTESIQADGFRFLFKGLL